MIGIYGIYKKEDNKCVYVGQSKNIENRIKRHLYYNCTHLQIDKPELYYGKQIETFDYYNKEELLEVEAFWINKLKPELNEVINRHRSNKFLKSHSDKMKGKNKGKRYIHKDMNVKMIYENEIKTYLLHGWELGRK